MIFRKIGSEVLNFLQRQSSFSVRNGTSEISLPFAKCSSFQSLISRKQLREIELQMVSAISFGWFAYFGKTLPLFKCRPNRFIATNSKHPKQLLEFSWLILVRLRNAVILIQKYKLMSVTFGQIQLHTYSKNNNLLVGIFLMSVPRICDAEGNMSPSYLMSLFSSYWYGKECLTAGNSQLNLLNFFFQKPTIARTVKSLDARGLKRKDTANQPILMNGWLWEIIALWHATSAVSNI